METPNDCNTAAATPQNHDQIIDALLERYLHLIDDYSRLREDHSRLQSSVFQHIARANFGAERGTWYGRDYYDERMQAASTVSVSVAAASGGGGGGAGSHHQGVVGDALLPCFSTVRRRRDGSRQRKQDEATQTTTAPEGTKENVAEPSSPCSLEKPAVNEEPEKQESPAPVDPIRWFGLMAPMSLRQAQAQSIRAVDEIVPRLATIAAEMAEVEIEVRRARKRRAKATSANAKTLARPNVPSVTAISA